MTSTEPAPPTTRRGTQLRVRDRDCAFALAHHQLAIVELMADRLDECWRHLGLAAAVYRSTPHLEGISYALEIAAAACLAEHDVDQAPEGATLAQELYDTFRLPVWPLLRPLHDRMMAEPASGHLGARAPADCAITWSAAVLQRMCEHHRTSSA